MSASFIGLPAYGYCINDHAHAGRLRPTLADAFAASVELLTAIPISACFRAGASLTPFRHPYQCDPGLAEFTTLYLSSEYSRQTRSCFPFDNLHLFVFALSLQYQASPDNFTADTHLNRLFL